MKSFIVFALFVAVAVAAPADPKDATIERYHFDNNGVEGFNWGFKTSEGLIAEEEGRLDNQGTLDEGISVKGEFSYDGPDGVRYSVSYTADKDGFKPQGVHLPA